MKKLFLLAVLIGAAVLAYFIIFKEPAGPKIRTTVRVIEGSVDFYELDDSGGRRFKKTVKTGETAEIVSAVGGKRGGILVRAFPNMVDAAAREASQWGKKLPDDQLAKFISEDELETFFTRVGEKARIRNIRVAAGADGFEGSGRIALGKLGVNASGRGNVELDKKTGRLHLHILEVKVGKVKLPAAALRELESIFDAVFNSPDFSLQVLEVEYRDKGILVYARRR